MTMTIFLKDLYSVPVWKSEFLPGREYVTLEWFRIAPTYSYGQDLYYCLLYQVKRTQQSQVPKVASIGVTSNPGAMLILFFLTLSHIQSLGGHTRKGYGGGGWGWGVGSCIQGAVIQTKPIIFPKGYGNNVDLLWRKVVDSHSFR